MLEDLEDFPTIRIKNAINTKDASVVRVEVIARGENFTVDGVAKRDPVDPFSEQIGANLALGRALERASRQLLRRADGLVKHNDDLRNGNVRNGKPKRKRAVPAKKAATRKR